MKCDALAYAVTEENTPVIEGSSHRSTTPKAEELIETLTRSNVQMAGRSSDSAQSVLHAMILFGGLLVALTGCAGQKVTRAGFLLTYDRMNPTLANRQDLTHSGRDFDLGFIAR